MSNVNADIADRIAHLERRQRISTAGAGVSAVIAVVAIAAAVGGRATTPPAAVPANSVRDVLRVHELDVVDRNGVTRVKIASPLPAPIIAGQQRASRGAKPEDTMSGILLFDAKGAERSGYATVDHGYSNVLLTLDDDRSGQHAMFIAEPGGGTTLRLFNAETRDRVDVAIDEDGPSIAMTRHGKEVFRQPAK